MLFRSPSILGSGVNVVFDPGGFLGAGPLTHVDSSVGGQVDLDATSLVESLPNQGSGFTLATVTFLQTAGLGTSPVNIINAFGGLLSNAEGTALDPTTVQNGCITVARSNTEPAQQCSQAPVPEPSTMALMGLGVAGLAARLRRRVQA